MSHPVAIGLCLSEYPLHPEISSSSSSTATTYYHYDVDDDNGDATIDIAKTPPIPNSIPARPFIAHVQYSTTASSLSSKFDMSERHIESEWLMLHDNDNLIDNKSSTNPSSSLSQLQQALNNNNNIKFNNKKNRKSSTSSQLFRFTPRSVLDTHVLSLSLSLSSSSSSSNSSSSSLTNKSHQPQQQYPQQQQQKPLSECMEHAVNTCKSMHLDISRFAHLFIPFNTPEASTVHLLQQANMRLSNYLSSSYLYTTDNKSSSSSSSGCGFNKLKSHRHIHIISNPNNCIAQKIRPCTSYRTVHSSRPVCENSRFRQRVYFEAVIIQQQQQSMTQVCIGITPSNSGTDKIIGSDKYHGVGFHSSGRIVKNRGQFQQDDSFLSFSVGDRIGIATYTDGSGDVSVALLVDHRVMTRVTIRTDEGNCQSLQLYGAVSIATMGTQVALLCCKEDWVMDVDKLLGAHMLGGSFDCMCA